MYPYRNMPLQPQQNQSLQHARPPQPFPTWSVRQNHNPYTQIQKGPIANNKDGCALMQSVDNPDVSATHASGMTAQAFRNVNVQDPTMQSEYFHNSVIDTSKFPADNDCA